VHRDRGELDGGKRGGEVAAVGQREAAYADLGAIGIGIDAGAAGRIGHDDHAILTDHEVGEDGLVKIGGIGRRDFLSALPGLGLVADGACATHEGGLTGSGLHMRHTSQIGTGVERLQRDALGRAGNELLFEGNSLELSFDGSAPLREVAGECFCGGGRRCDVISHDA